MSGEVKAAYRWLADGTKLGVRDAAGSDGLEYTGSLIYRRGSGGLTLESAGFGGGRINASQASGGTLYTPNYYVTDHLGSVRVIWCGGSGVSSRSDYYPFGERHDNPRLPVSTTNRIGFSGKEIQTTGNLPYLDFGARFFGGKLPIWTTQDPLAEKYYPWSPYNYTLNRPVSLIDPDSRFAMHLTGVAAQQAFAYAQQLFGGTGDDGYTYDEYGNIERVDNRGGAEYDVLYDIGAKGGWRFESGILGQLAEDLGKDRGTNAVGSKRQAIRDTDSVDDMARLFIILADRTDVEWSLSVGEYNGIRNKLGIMTWGNRIRTGTSPFKVDGLKVHIHSHPAKEVEQNLPG